VITVWPPEAVYSVLVLFLLAYGLVFTWLKRRLR